MGSERDVESSHGGGWSAPKLILAGRIDGAVNGRPVILIAEGQTLLITVESWRTLLTVRRSLRFLILALPANLTQSGIRLFAGSKWLGSVAVYPNPSFLVRMLLPREVMAALNR